MGLSVLYNRLVLCNNISFVNDVRGVKRGYGLSPSRGYNFIVNEKTSGLLVAPTVRGFNINEETHFV